MYVCLSVCVVVLIPSCGPTKPSYENKIRVLWHIFDEFHTWSSSLKLITESAEAFCSFLCLNGCLLISTNYSHLLGI